MTQEIRNEARRRERECADAAARRQRFGSDVRAVAGTAEGRRLLAWLLGRGGLFAPDRADDPGEVLFQAGKRVAAVELWNLLRGSLGREAFAGIALAEGEED